MNLFDKLAAVIGNERVSVSYRKVNLMTKYVLEPETESRWRGFEEIVEVCDHSGHRLGYFRPIAPEGVPLKELSRFTDEEIRQRCTQTTGRPLADILRDLNQQ